jgi:hypothetical protein
MKHTIHDNKYPVNPACPKQRRNVYPVKKIKLQNEPKVGEASCFVIIHPGPQGRPYSGSFKKQNEPNFPRFQSKNKDFQKNEPNSNPNRSATAQAVRFPTLPTWLPTSGSFKIQNKPKFQFLDSWVPGFLGSWILGSLGPWILGHLCKTNPNLFTQSVQSV